MRTYYRASSGSDAAVQTWAYLGTFIATPFVVVAVVIHGAYLKLTEPPEKPVKKPVAVTAPATAQQQALARELVIYEDYLTIAHFQAEQELRALREAR